MNARRRKPGGPAADPPHLLALVPGLTREQAAEILPCAKFDHDQDSPPVAAIELLLIKRGQGAWEAHPRCLRHPAAWDVRLLHKVNPRVETLIVQLSYDDTGYQDLLATPLGRATAEAAQRWAGRVHDVTLDAWKDAAKGRSDHLPESS